MYREVLRYTMNAFIFKLFFDEGRVNQQVQH